MPRRHWMDDAVQEVVKFIVEEPPRVAEAMRDHGRAPGAANLSRGELYDYYARNWWNADGSDNVPFRTALAERVSIDQYAKVKHAMEGTSPAKRKPGEPAPNPWADEPDEEAV